MIRANYFDDSRDLDAALEAVRLARAFVETSAYAELRGEAVAPTQAETTPDELRAYVRRSAGTIYHPGGTCRMGRGRGSVVDGELRVHGVSGLRVADASVMPRVVNSQTHAACVMIAERAAALLLGSPRRPAPAP